MPSIRPSPARLLKREEKEGGEAPALPPGSQTESGPESGISRGDEEDTGDGEAQNLRGAKAPSGVKGTRVWDATNPPPGPEEALVEHRCGRVIEDRNLRSVSSGVGTEGVGLRFHPPAPKKRTEKQKMTCRRSAPFLRQGGYIDTEKGGKGRGPNRPYCELGKILDALARERDVRGPYGIARCIHDVTGHEVSGQSVSKYMYGEQSPKQAFIDAFSQAFGLDPQERCELAWTYAYGIRPRDRGVLLEARTPSRSRPAPE